MKKSLFVIFLFFHFITIQAQDSPQRKVALLPIISNGIDFASTGTSESILRMELTKQPTLKVITEKETFDALENEDCFDEVCAKSIGEKLKTEEVILCKLNLLGEKIIVQYYLVDVTTGKYLLAEQTTALNLADLEPVMKRVAISIASHSPFSANAEVGNIVGKESIESLRQKTRYNFGVGFGYLFPQNGYDDDRKSFTLNAYFDHEINDYAVGLMAGARDGFAINIYGNYLFSKTDICPYLGTSLGMHWVNHSEIFGTYVEETGEYIEEDKTGNGIELGLKGGLRILHTYNVQLFISLEYIVTFNDYDDKAIVFSIGIL